MNSILNLKKVAIWYKHCDERPEALMVTTYEERGDNALITVVPPHQKNGTENWVKGVTEVKLTQITPAVELPNFFPTVAALKIIINHSEITEVPAV